MKMFDRQLIFSMDESVFKAQFLHNIIKDGTVLRYLPIPGEVQLSIPKTHSDYELIEFTLKKDKIFYEKKMMYYKLH